jgi:hypothetical protein
MRKPAAAAKDPIDLSIDDDLREWYLLSPAERFRETERLWANFLLLGGTCEADFDPQGPFYFPPEKAEGTADGGPGLHPVRGGPSSRLRGRRLRR